MRRPVGVMYVWRRLARASAFWRHFDSLGPPKSDAGGTVGGPTVGGPTVGGPTVGGPL